MSRFPRACALGPLLTFFDAWVFNFLALVIYQSPRRGLFIGAKIYTTLAAALLIPGHFIFGRRFQFFRLFSDQLNCLRRTGGYAKTTADALIPYDLVGIFIFLDGIYLTALVRADAASIALIRINFSVIVGIDDL